MLLSHCWFQLELAFLDNYTKLLKNRMKEQDPGRPPVQGWPLSPGSEGACGAGGDAGSDRGPGRKARKDQRQRH